MELSKTMLNIRKTDLGFFNLNCVDVDYEICKKNMFMWDGMEYKNFTILTEKDYYTIKYKYEIKKYSRIVVHYDSKEHNDIRYWTKKLKIISGDYLFIASDIIYVDSKKFYEKGNFWMTIKTIHDVFLPTIQCWKTL